MRGVYCEIPPFRGLGCPEGQASHEQMLVFWSPLLGSGMESESYWHDVAATVRWGGDVSTKFRVFKFSVYHAIKVST